jgi:antitoxin (DNA-binding transcriptional repressor) of toxin-antitoxin stability system
MKTANIRTVRHDLATVLGHVRNGETVAITYRKRTVALLTPPPRAEAERDRPWSGLSARLERLQAQPMPRETAADMLAADRERY